MRSGKGFGNDLRVSRQLPPDAEEIATQVTQPSVIIGTPRDGQVPFAHSESLAASIPRAELVATNAETHFPWFGSDYPASRERIRDFLTVS